jgi:hypothetical protein
MGRSSGIAESPPQVIDSTGGNQLTEAATVGLSQQRPSVNDAPVLKHSGSRSVANVEGHQPHPAAP